MKKQIRANAETRNSKYDKRYKMNNRGQDYIVYTVNEDDPEYLMFQITEVHPYDLAEYAWARKADPINVNFYKDGSKIDTIPVPEYDEDYYENCSEYVDEVIDRAMVKLRKLNKDVKHRIDRT